MMQSQRFLPKRSPLDDLHKNTCPELCNMAKHRLLVSIKEKTPPDVQVSVFSVVIGFPALSKTRISPPSYEGSAQEARGATGRRAT